VLFIDELLTFRLKLSVIFAITVVASTVFLFLKNWDSFLELLHCGRFFKKNRIFVSCGAKLIQCCKKMLNILELKVLLFI